MTDGTTIVNINLPGAPGGLLEALNQLREIAMSNQEKLNAIAAALETAAAGIRADLEALKKQVADGEALDFTGLEAKAAALEALDAENPPPVAASRKAKKAAGK